MTEKQMISTLKGLTFGTVVGSKGVEALEMAIKALENHDTFMKYAYSQGKQDALSVTTTSSDEIKTVYYPQVDGITPTIVAQEPCTDAVSREAVIEAITKHMDGEDKNCKLQLSSVVEWIRDLPTVKPEYKECRTLDEFIKEQTECEAQRS